MNIKEILEEEFKRLNRINNELEKLNHVQIAEQINKNALTICEIAKALR